MIRCYRTSVQRRRIYCHISPRRREGREGKRKEPKARSFLEFGPIARCLCLTASVTEGPKLSRVKSSWPVDCGLNCLPRTRLGPQEQENKNKKSHKYYSLIQVTQLNSQSKTHKVKLLTRRVARKKIPCILSYHRKGRPTLTTGQSLQVRFVPCPGQV